MRLHSISFFGLLLAPLLGCGQASRVEAKSPPPNVILILLDTLRADRLGCYDYKRPTSPYLDALAQRGALFRDATSGSSWTMPSMTSLIQGQYSTEFRDVPREDDPTLGEIFQGAGYHTEGLVANTLLTEDNGFHRGFDFYDAQHQSKEVQRARVKSDGVRDVARWAEDMVPLALERTDLHLAKEGEQPLLLYVHLMDVHAKYRRHEEIGELLRGRSPRLPTPWHTQLHDEYLDAEQAKLPAGAPNIQRDWSKNWNLINGRRERYDREIRHTDQWVGTLMQGLEQRGVLDNAVVVIASDHGESLWEAPAIYLAEPVDIAPPQAFFQAQHDHNLIQGLIHVPLIMFGSGIPAGTVIEDAVENIDVLPTLMHLCNIPNRGELHGRSLVDLMQGKPEPPRLIHSMVLQRRMLRDPVSGYKLVEPTPTGLAWRCEPQLYDLPNDPLEQNNLAPKGGPELDRLRAELATWIATYPDESTLGRERNARTLEMLEALGYASPGEDAEQE